MILVGAIQGLVMSVLLFSVRENKVPARSLAWLLVLFSVASLYIWSWSIASWQKSVPYLLFTQCFPLIVIMPVGPLIWLYVRSTLNPGLRIDRKDKMHFLPVIIDLVPPLINTTFVVLLLLGFAKSYGPSLNWFVDNYNVYSDVPRWFSVSYYCWLSMRLITRHNADPTIEGQSQHICWLKQFLFVFMAFQAWWFCYLIPYIIPAYTDWVLDNLGWYPIYVPLALLIYVLGTRGYLQVRQIRRIEKKEIILSYSEQQLAETMTALKNAMERDKLFLDAGLNLTMMSKHTSIPAKQISAVLNQHVNKSFNEFVNEYRVNEVIRRLALPGSNKLTLAGLGFECGFNSQPTFQRAFKAVTGTTPSQYQSTLA